MVLLCGKQGGDMAFVVRADSRKPGEGTFLADKVTRFAALETALGLIEQGMTGVTIMGDNGRVYTHPEFAAFLAEKA
jgi:hypothetical protein